jgi:hypothetical protein
MRDDGLLFLLHPTDATFTVHQFYANICIDANVAEKHATGSSEGATILALNAQQCQAALELHHSTQLCWPVLCKALASAYGLAATVLHTACAPGGLSMPTYNCQSKLPKPQS